MTNPLFTLLVWFCALIGVVGWSLVVLFMMLELMR